MAVDQGQDEPPVWLDVEVWDKAAENVANHLSKGRLIGVQGRIAFQEWENEEGWSSKYFIKAGRIEYLDRPPGEAKTSE